MSKLLLPEKTYTIGRSKDCDVYVATGEGKSPVSRHQFDVYYDVSSSEVCPVTLRIVGSSMFTVNGSENLRPRDKNGSAERTFDDRLLKIDIGPTKNRVFMQMEWIPFNVAYSINKVDLEAQSTAELVLSDLGRLIGHSQPEITAETTHFLETNLYLSLSALEAVIKQIPVVEISFFKEILQYLHASVKPENLLGPDLLSQNRQVPALTFLLEYDYEKYFPKPDDFLFEKGLKQGDRSGLFKDFCVVLPSRLQYTKFKSLILAAGGKPVLYDLEEMAQDTDINVGTKSMASFCLKLGPKVLLMKSRTKDNYDEFEKLCYQILRQTSKKLHIGLFSPNALEEAVKSIDLKAVVGEEDGSNTRTRKKRRKIIDPFKIMTEESPHAPIIVPENDSEVLAEPIVATPDESKSLRKRKRRKIIDPFELMTQESSSKATSETMNSHQIPISESPEITKDSALPEHLNNEEVVIEDSEGQELNFNRNGGLKDSTSEASKRSRREKRERRITLEMFGLTEEDFKTAPSELDVQVESTQSLSQDLAKITSVLDDIADSNLKKVNREERSRSMEGAEADEERQGHSQEKQRPEEREKGEEKKRGEENDATKISFIKAIEKSKSTEEQKIKDMFGEGVQEKVSKAEMRAIRSKIKVNSTVALRARASLEVNSINSQITGGQRKNFKRFVKRRKGDVPSQGQSGNVYRTFVPLVVYDDSNERAAEAGFLDEPVQGKEDLDDIDNGLGLIRSAEPLFVADESDEEEENQQRAPQKATQKALEPDSDFSDDDTPKFKFLT